MTERPSIDSRQLDSESGRLFRAYSTEYRAAKRLRTFRFTLSILIALAGPILSWWSLVPVSLLGALPGFWLVTTRLIVVPGEERHVRRAVRIHERFDVRLFDLAWPEALAGAEPSEEDVADATRKGLQDQRLLRQHEEGWYPPTDRLPWPVRVLEAQRASATYGRRQHSAFSAFVGACIGIALLGAVVIGVTAEMSLDDWLLTFVLSSPPILLDAIELAISHRRMSRQKKAIESRIEALWRSELSATGTLTADHCRTVQDDVFKLRVANAQVPEWFHWLHRNRNEENMHEASSARIGQYKAAIGSG